MAKSIIRTDVWQLAASGQQQRWVRETIALYRAYTGALIGVLWTHWPAIANSPSRCSTVERLIHATSKNPHPRYRFFDRRFYKFPSYLRRAAIEAAIGQVESFVTRYDQWQSGQRKRPTSTPPKRTSENVLNPALYWNQCLTLDADRLIASIKVWNGTDWVWTSLPITTKRHRHSLPGYVAQAPTLVLRGKRVQLSCPFKTTVLRDIAPAQRLAAFDLGINSSATGCILGPDGTVLARQFFGGAADIDRRDRGLARIPGKARKTMGKRGTLSEGFCRGLYRKAANRNRDMANRLSGALVAFAIEHGASVLTFEHLKHFRPSSGRKGSRLRQRFHGWLHRLLVTKVQERTAVLGLRVVFVNPRGTSKLAFDGTGAVKRSTTNWSLATFQTGKQYNADLNACLNIGARGWYRCLGLDSRKTGASVSGRSSRALPRIPVTLSSLWAHAHGARLAESEAATTPALAG